MRDIRPCNYDEKSLEYFDQILTLINAVGILILSPMSKIFRVEISTRGVSPRRTKAAINFPFVRVEGDGSLRKKDNDYQTFFLVFSAAVYVCFLVFNLSRVKLQEEATIVALENVCHQLTSLRFHLYISMRLTNVHSFFSGFWAICAFSSQGVVQQMT